MKLAISEVLVTEGDLYELMGEDSLIHIYDSSVQVVCDGDVYQHKHVFKGYFTDDYGFMRPDMGSSHAAHNLAIKVSNSGFINTDHWLCVGNFSEDFARIATIYN